jgi:hypothetical protein
MIFQELLAYCKAKALEEMFNPTEETVWKSITRSYSEKFHVPLPEVRKMDPEAVLSEIFEAKYEDIDPIEEVENLLEEIYTMESPDYQKEQRKEMDSFIKNVEEREKKRLEGMKLKEEKQQDTLREQPKRTGGSVDFSNLKDDK